MPDSYQIVSIAPVAINVSPTLVSERRMDADYYNPEFLENQDRIEGCGYPLITLGRLWSDGKYGTLPSSDDYADQGVVLIRGGDFRDLGVVEDENLVRVPSYYWETSQKARTSAGEVLLLAKGATIDGPNSVALCPDRFEKAIVNGSVFRIKVKKDVDAAYLAAYMATTPFLLQKRRFISNTGIFYNDLESIENFAVVVPTRPVQTYVGDKVWLAERCRTQARELWKASEKLLSETLGMPLSAVYFEKIDPAELQSESYRLKSIAPVAAWIQADIADHELGPQYFHPRRANVILKLRSSGVELVRLTDLAVRRSDRVSANKASHVPYYVGLADIDSTIGHFDSVSPQNAGITGTSALFRSGDILFSKLRPYLNKVSICPDYIKQACGSTELLTYRVCKGVLPYYVFFVLKSNVVLYQIIDVTSGSTLPRVDPEIIDDILVPMIPVERRQIIDTNTRQVFSFLYRATQLIREAKSDVEALIEGRLDVEGILAGRIKSPTWEDIAV